MMRGRAPMSLKHILRGGLRHRTVLGTISAGTISARPFSAAGADIKVGHMESMEGNMAGAPLPPEHIVRSSGSPFRANRTISSN